MRLSGCDILPRRFPKTGLLTSRLDIPVSTVNIILVIRENMRKNHPILAWIEGVIVLMIIFVTLIWAGFETKALAVTPVQIDNHSVILLIVIFGILGLIFELLVAVTYSPP